MLVRFLFRRSADRLVSVVCVLLLFGCATLPPPTAVVRADPNRLTAFEFTGRIGVKQDEKGSYGNIRWVKRGLDTDIILLSPLGQVAAQIRSRPNQATLTLADNREFRAEDGENLIREVLGYSVPVKGLNYWLLGVAAPGSPVEEDFRPDGLLTSLKQDGWLIQYTDYLSSGEVQLPRRMMLSRGDLEIRLAIDQWTLASEAR